MKSRQPADVMIDAAVPHPAEVLYRVMPMNPAAGLVAALIKPPSRGREMPVIPVLRMSEAFALGLF